MKPDKPNGDFFKSSKPFFKKPVFPNPSPGFFNPGISAPKDSEMFMSRTHTRQDMADPSGSNRPGVGLPGYNTGSSMSYSIPPYSFTGKKDFFEREYPKVNPGDPSTAHLISKMKNYEDKVEGMKMQMQEMTGLLKSLQSVASSDKAEPTFNISDYDTMNYIRYPADGDMYRPQARDLGNPSQIQYVYNELIKARAKGSENGQKIFASGPRELEASDVHRKHQTPTTSSYYFRPTQQKKLFARDQFRPKAETRQCASSCESFQLETLKKFESISRSLLNIMNVQMEIKGQLSKNDRIRRAEFRRLRLKIDNIDHYLYEDETFFRTGGAELREGKGETGKIEKKLKVKKKENSERFGKKDAKQGSSGKKGDSGRLGAKPQSEEIGILAGKQNEKESPKKIIHQFIKKNNKKQSQNDWQTKKLPIDWFHVEKQLSDKSRSERTNFFTKSSKSEMKNKPENVCDQKPMKASDIRFLSSFYEKKAGGGIFAKIEESKRFNPFIQKKDRFSDASGLGLKSPGFFSDVKDHAAFNLEKHPSDNEKNIDVRAKTVEKSILNFSVSSKSGCSPGKNKRKQKAKLTPPDSETESLSSKSSSFLLESNSSLLGPKRYPCDDKTFEERLQNVKRLLRK